MSSTSTQPRPDVRSMLLPNWTCHRKLPDFKAALTENGDLPLPIPTPLRSGRAPSCDPTHCGIESSSPRPCKLCWASSPCLQNQLISTGVSLWGQLQVVITSVMTATKTLWSLPRSYSSISRRHNFDEDARFNRRFHPNIAFCRHVREDSSKDMPGFLQRCPPQHRPRPHPNAAWHWRCDDSDENCFRSSSYVKVHDSRRLLSCQSDIEIFSRSRLGHLRWWQAHSNIASTTSVRKMPLILPR